MTVNDFRQKIADISKTPVNQIHEHTSLRDDLGIDSLQMVNLIVEVVQSFGLELSAIKSFKEVQTVGNMYRVLSEEGTK